MTFVSDKTRVLNTLRGRKRGISALELAEKLNISSRNAVYSYISSLRSEGHPIAGTNTSSGTKYSYAA